MKKRPLSGSIDEEYYPISLEILSSFPKYRPSVNLYVFEEEIKQLYPIAVKDHRLTNKKIEEIIEACKEGRLFVPRSDHHIYVQHLAKQADFVLIDPNLNILEIIQILFQALSLRLNDLFEQPLPIVYEPAYTDLMVFTEYLWRDKDRIKQFMPKLHTGKDDPISHTLNVIIVGTWLYFESEKKPVRKVLDKIVQGLFLHDIGYAKIPAYILNKQTMLTREETDKIAAHPRTGVLLAQKFATSVDEVNQIIFQHHERLDGNGYPNRLAGSAISDLGLLAGTADAFSSMITDRVNTPRMKTLDAAQALFKDKNFLAKYTGLLLNGYAGGSFDNI